MRYLPGVQTRQETGSQIECFVRHWQRRGYGLWAVEDRVGGEFIGFIGLTYNDDWSAGEHKVEVGWRFERAGAIPDHQRL